MHHILHAAFVAVVVEQVFVLGIGTTLGVVIGRKTKRGRS